MENMTQPDAYLKQRWQTQRDYYSKQSARNKSWYQSLQLFIVLGAIAVPIILNIPEVPKLIATILSGLIAGAAALENVYRFGENWRTFRQTLEALKRERVLFETGAGAYRKSENSFYLFVERVESLIGEETERYFPEEGEKAQGQK
jgi:hypothetical protein